MPNGMKEVIKFSSTINYLPRLRRNREIMTEDISEKIFSKKLVCPEKDRLKFLKKIYKALFKRGTWNTLAAKGV